MEIGFEDVISITLATITFGAMVYGVYMMIKHKLSPSDLLVNNARMKFELIAFGSTFIEVVSLSLMSMDRGVTPGSAIGRYLLFGILEVLATFMFSHAMAEAFADNKLTWKEGGKLFLYFGLATFFTFTISVCYGYEIGAYDLHFTGSLNPLYYLQISANSDVPADLIVLFMIWATPIINLFSFILTYEKLKISPKEKYEKYEEEEEEEEEENSKKKEIEFEDAVEKIAELFGVPKKTLERRISAYVEGHRDYKEKPDDVIGHLHDTCIPKVLDIEDMEDRIQSQEDVIEKASDIISEIDKQTKSNGGTTRSTERRTANNRLESAKRLIEEIEADRGEVIESLKVTLRDRMRILPRSVS